LPIEFSFEGGLVDKLLSQLSDVLLLDLCLVTELLELCVGVFYLYLLLFDSHVELVLFFMKLAYFVQSTIPLPGQIIQLLLDLSLPAFIFLEFFLDLKDILL
jgi:hypothetical protein